MVIAFVVFQNRSNFFSGIPPFHYLLQITLTDSTSNSSPTHSLQKPLFLSPLHLYIITDNHSRPFCHLTYHVRVTQLPSFRSTNNLYIFVIHEITHFACSFPLLQNTLFSSTPPQLDSHKPPSVQICIYVILFIHRWVGNSVMINQVMETTPCWYDVNSLYFPFPFHLLHYGTNTPNQPTTYEYLMAWWKTNNRCCRGCGGYYYECNFTFQSKIENHFLRYPFL